MRKNKKVGRIIVIGLVIAAVLIGAVFVVSLRDKAKQEYQCFSEEFDTFTVNTIFDSNRTFNLSGHFGMIDSYYEDAMQYDHNHLLYKGLCDSDTAKKLAAYQEKRGELKVAFSEHAPLVETCHNLIVQMKTAEEALESLVTRMEAGERITIREAAGILEDFQAAESELIDQFENELAPLLKQTFAPQDSDWQLERIDLKALETLIEESRAKSDSDDGVLKYDSSPLERMALMTTTMILSNEQMRGWNIHRLEPTETLNVLFLQDNVVEMIVQLNAIRQLRLAFEA